LLIYFDSSVLDAVARQDKGGRLKALLKANGAQAVGSVYHLLEAFPIQDTATRIQMVRTVLRVARCRETDPLMYYELRSLIAEVRQHHPEWLQVAPDLRLISSDRAAHRNIWDNLKEDPSYLPAGFIAGRETLRAVLAESKVRQRPARVAALAGQPPPAVIPAEVRHILHPLISSLPPMEAIWRETAGGIWWNAIFGRDPQVRSLEEWIAPLMVHDRLDLESWMLFWLTELDGTAMPSVRIQMLTNHFQAGLKVDAGHAADIMHAGYSAITDRFLTADAGLYSTLQKVQGIAGAQMADPIFIDRSQMEIIDTIRMALGW